MDWVNGVSATVIEAGVTMAEAFVSGTTVEAGRVADAFWFWSWTVWATAVDIVDSGGCDGPQAEMRDAIAITATKILCRRESDINGSFPCDWGGKINAFNYTVL